LAHTQTRKHLVRGADVLPGNRDLGVSSAVSPDKRGNLPSSFWRNGTLPVTRLHGSWPSQTVISGV